MGLNKQLIIGHLGKEPEVRQAGQSQIAAFTVCVTEKYKDNQGQLQEESEWFSCEWWNPGNVLQYLHKGTQVYIEGAKKTDTWADQQGQKHSIEKTRVISLQLLGAKPQTAPQPQGQPQYQQPAPPPQYQGQPQGQYPPQYQQPAPPQYQQPAQQQYIPGVNDLP